MDEHQQVLAANHIKKIMGFENVGLGLCGSEPYLRDKVSALPFLILGW